MNFRLSIKNELFFPVDSEKMSHHTTKQSTIT